jgi:hypothetical protein
MLHQVLPNIKPEVRNTHSTLVRKLKARGMVQIVLRLIICAKGARLKHSLLGFGCRWVNARPIRKGLSTTLNMPVTGARD